MTTISLRNAFTMCSLAVCFVLTLHVNAFSRHLPKSDTASVGTDSIFTVVDKMAEYPGGMNALVKFLQHNIRYPAEARRHGDQGSVFVSFVVEKDGTISNPAVVKGVTMELDDEAMRVISLMPNWLPGSMSDGTIVASRFVLPIKFKLAEPKKLRRRDYH